MNRIKSKSTFEQSVSDELRLESNLAVYMIRMTFKTGGDTALHM